MSIQLSKALLSKGGMSRDEKFQTMQLRRTALTEIGKSALYSLGYVLGSTLKVPGSHAFTATQNGKSVKVGIKTSADRWVGAARDKDGNFGVLSKVDEIFVVAFDNWHDPKRVQVYKFKPNVIISIAEKVYSEAEKLGNTGLKWFPLDMNHGQWPSTTQHDANLAKHGEIIFDESIAWGEGDEPPPSKPNTTVSPAKTDETPILERIKAMLSEHMGVRPELIEIDIRVKI